MNEILSFGAWVRQRRKALDLTQMALAKQVGCAAVTIKKIEQEERRPSLQMARLLAERLAISPSMRDDFIKMGRGQYAPPKHKPEEDLPPPAFLQHVSPVIEQTQPPFVTRQHELAQLDRQLSTALTGNGRVVFILGEAGRGKTRLMGEFSRQAQETYPDLIVANGSCNAQAGIGDPYLPFRDVLNMLAGDLEARWMAGSISREQVLRLWALLPHTIQAITAQGPALVDTLIPGLPLIHRVSPYIAGQPKWLEEFQIMLAGQKRQPANIEQSYLLEQVTQMLRALASRQPILLLLDDLQWMDDASKSLLFHLGRRLSGSRIMILGAYRPSEIALGRPSGIPGQSEQHSLEPVINEFKREFGDIEIDLGRSSPADGRGFIDALLDSEPNRLPATFRETLFQHTKGHPLFTVEILRNMQENGNLVRNEAGQWVERPSSAVYPLPARVEAVIEQRISRLDEALQRLLTVASVEGEVFTVQIVARLLELDERHVLHQLARVLGERHRLVREYSEDKVDQQRLNQYQFNHVLFQEFLYQRLTPGERRLYHRDMGEALEAILAAQTTEITSVFLHQSDRIGEVLARPYPECLVQFGPALFHHFWQGKDWGKAASYAMCAGAAAMKAYALREAIEYFERALEALDKVPNLPQEFTYEAILYWIEAAFKFRPYPDQLLRLSQAEKIARQLNDPQRLIRALHWTANVHLARGLWMRAGPALMECLTLADEIGDESIAVRPVYFNALMTTFVNPRDSLALLERAIDLARKYEDRHIEALALGTKAHQYAQLGQYDRAQQVMRQTYDALGRSESPLTESDVDLTAAWTYLAMNDAQHSLEYSQRSVEKAIAIDNMDCICYGFDCIGYSNLEMQNIQEAARAFEEAVERSAKSGAVIPKLMGQAGLAMAQFCAGRAAALQDLETARLSMQKFDHHVGAANAAQLLGTCLIQMGDLERAEDYLNLACSFYRRAEMSPYLVRTLASLVLIFEQQGRLVQAQDVQIEIGKLMGELKPQRG